MALTGWDSANYLFTTTMPITAYPLMVAAWAHRAATSATARTIVSLDQVGGSQHRFAALRQEPTGAATPNSVGVSAYDGTNQNWAYTTVASTQGAWFSAVGAWNSTTSRDSYMNAANMGSNTTTITPGAPTQLWIGRNTFFEFFGATDGLAEVSIWNTTGFSAGNRDSLAAKLYNGGAAAAGGNPLNITAESAQPWTGKLVAYWPLANTGDLAGADGFGATLSIQGTITNFAGSPAHPTIDAITSAATNLTPQIWM